MAVLAAGASARDITMRWDGYTLAAACVVALANASVDEVSCHADSFYECGRQIGAQKAAAIRESLEGPYAGLITYARSGPGRAVFEQLRKVNSEQFPYIAEECRGMAAGAGVGEEELLVGNLANELAPFAPAGDFLPKSCSDFHILGGAAKGVRAW
jgi:hypothetical protein